MDDKKFSNHQKEAKELNRLMFGTPETCECEECEQYRRYAEQMVQMYLARS